MSKIITACAALAVVVVAGSALAQDTESPRTRAEVIAELAAARHSGELQAMSGEDGGSAWLQARAWRSATTRAEVLAQRAAACGEVACAALMAEDGGSMQMAAAAARPSGTTRAQVLAAAEQARASGELQAMTGEDSGSAFLARRAGYRTTVYAGPNAGEPTVAANGQPRAAG
jgi:hypothetical protein